MTLRAALTIPGEPIDAGSCEAAWSTAGRPSFGATPLAVSAQFYVTASTTGDLAAYLDRLLDALTGYLFDDRTQVVCFAGIHRIRTEFDPRTTISAWTATTDRGRIEP